MRPNMPDLPDASVWVPLSTPDAHYPGASLLMRKRRRARVLPRNGPHCCAI
jgi:hypothetical protein